MASDITYGPDVALVVVDMQNDFAHPDGSLYVTGGDVAVAKVNEQILAAREAGALIVYTQDWHPAETPHFVTHGGTWPVHCVKDTWGAELHAALEVADDATVVRKGTGQADGYSGFTVRDLESDADVRTELDPLLRERGIGRVVVVGIATDVCVKATVLDAVELGYDTVVIPDATAAVDLEEGDGARAVAEMAAAGAVVS
ncbi:isochorismatase family protein [Actinomarinicola tropica]|uniref:nicotinamidase n=1 Tax=Actinomarinicola tropica TaxID=2789776 RepID=A0A5Q2RSI5_9ACTN|nr:isochorismatase family protein [Actinomarinicola tropica]QGG96165.1 isochorismatase family protein [Actinomarinicola tropica]